MPNGKRIIHYIPRTKTYVANLHTDIVEFKKPNLEDIKNFYNHNYTQIFSQFDEKRHVVRLHGEITDLTSSILVLEDNFPDVPTPVIPNGFYNLYGNDFNNIEFGIAKEQELNHPFSLNGVDWNLITNDVEEFFNSREKYKEKGLVFRRTMAIIFPDDCYYERNMFLETLCRKLKDKTIIGLANPSATQIHALQYGDITEDVDGNFVIVYQLSNNFDFYFFTAASENSGLGGKYYSIIYGSKKEISNPYVLSTIDSIVDLEKLFVQINNPKFSQKDINNIVLDSSDEMKKMFKSSVPFNVIKEAVLNPHPNLDIYTSKLKQLKKMSVPTDTIGFLGGGSAERRELN